MADRIGQQLGNYRIVRELGRGAFADVYLGEHIYLQSLAALKILYASLEQSDMLHFLSEAQTLVRLRHPHIVRVLEYVVEQGTPVLMMDYAPGGSVRKLHPRGSRLPLPMVVDYVKQVASALHYAHGKGVIHRDVKPENLLLGEEQELLLSDFGLALLAPSPENLSTQEMAGTISYMAPEQIRGKPGFASDQYALGVIAYEWLCGRRPFEGASLAVLRQHLEDAPPRLRELHTDIPVEVEEVVLRTLAKDPQQRFVSLQAFASALERASRASGAGEDSEITVKLKHVPVPSSAPLPERAWPDAYIPAGVYLAAASADEPFTTRLQADLEAGGMPVWNGRYTDAHSASDGEEAMRQEIRAARLVAVVLSSHTRTSRTVKAQLQLARMYGREILLIWQAGENWAKLLPDNWEPTNVIDLVDARGRRYQEALDEIATSLKDGSAATLPLDLLLAVPRQEESRVPRNPYKGLRAFTEADAQDFFGRDRMVASLVEAVTEMTAAEEATSHNGRLLTVIGPSGSGKSSVVLAGLLPWLRQGAIRGSDDWVYLEPMVPGRYPIEALGLLLTAHFPQRSLASIREDLDEDSGRGLHVLASQLVREQPGGRVVLLLDQFEEVFTQTEDEEERQRFIGLLLSAASEPGGPLVVVLTLRADFYDRPMRYPDLHRLMQRHLVQVLPMELEELRATIEYPASLPDVQLTFEGTLVGDLLYEMQGQHAALPLLQFTLEQLVERRVGHRVTLEAYRAIGGVKGALAQHAERTYAALPSEEHRRFARVLFLRLIDPGATEQDTTRRRAALSEFTTTDPFQTRLLRETIDAFVAARLLTSNKIAGTTTLEVSHEALIREWKRLSEWVHEAHEDIRIQLKLSEDVAEWERRHHSKDQLYRGSELQRIRAWARRNTPSEQEMSFVQASMARRLQAIVSLVILFFLFISLAGTAGWFILTRPPDPTLVTNLKDDGVGSLRWSINNAPSGSTITFAQGLKGTINLTSADLTFNKKLNISGPGKSAIALSSKGGTGFGIHVFSGASVTIANLSMNNSQPRTQGGLPLITNEGVLTMVNSDFSDNVVSSGSGRIISNTGKLTFDNSTLSNNSIPGGGILISNDFGALTIRNSIVSGSSKFSITGINNLAALIVTGSTFSGFTAGAIYSEYGGVVAISNSTFFDNAAEGEGGELDGGAISFYDPNAGSGDLPLVSDASFITFCTIYSNTASLAGGGIFVPPGYRGQVIISNDIITANQTRTPAGTVITDSGGQPTGEPVGGSDIFGKVISGGYNFIGDFSGATFLDPEARNLHATDKDQKQFGDLKIASPPGNHGGPTPTLALLPDSSAIDTIPRDVCLASIHLSWDLWANNDVKVGYDHLGTLKFTLSNTADQRGVKRPQGAQCDIGAYEYQR